MKETIYILDSSAIIGGFNSDALKFTTNGVILEIKDYKSKLILQSALAQGHLTKREPNLEDLKRVKEVIRLSGDILRLSEVDKEIVALALTLKKENYSPKVVTDDYSMQNVLKILKIPFQSILTSGIEEVFQWIRVCKGCKKEYPPEYPFDECEICGSHIFKKRVKKSDDHK